MGASLGSLCPMRETPGPVTSLPATGRGRVGHRTRHIGQPPAHPEEFPESNAVRCYDGGERPQLSQAATRRAWSRTHTVPHQRCEDTS